MKKEVCEMENSNDWERKYWEEKFKRIDDVLAMNKDQLNKQALEYERRLGDLNHENARVLKAQEASVSVDKFEGVTNQIYSKLDDIKKEMGLLAEFKTSMGGQTQAKRDIMDLIKLIIIVAAFFIANFVIKK